MHQTRPLLSRRRMLAASAAGIALPGLAQTRPDSAPRTPVITQIVDASINQQDVTKDFLVGWQTAWQGTDARGGSRLRGLRIDTVQTDGSASSIQQALRAAADNPDCIALAGSAGDSLSRQLVQGLGGIANPPALIAPWLHQAVNDSARVVCPIFATRAQQLAHALRSLSVMGVTELGVVQTGTAEAAAQQLQRDEIQAAASALGLRVRHLGATTDLHALGQRLPQASPAVLIFLGGTPELVPFTQGLARQNRQRYVIALADVNLQTVMQMGAARQTALIATQVVPLVNAAMPLVRGYRERLGRLFDEPPTPLSLSGYVAGLYTQRLLASVDGALSRGSVLTQARRREALDLEGLRIAFDAQGQLAGYVTQSMLTADGRVVG